MRYIGIERNTDLREPRSTIVVLPNESRARTWAAAHGANGTPAFPGDYEAGRNGHRRLRRVYGLPKGTRLPTLAKAAEYAERHSTPTYPMTAADGRAELISKLAVKSWTAADTTNSKAWA